MKSIIICDKNKGLIDKLKSISLGNAVRFEFICGDVIELHENTPNSKIVTASNPSFNPAGGLDAILADKYSWKETKEFVWNDDLFFVVSVDENIKATQKQVQRALCGVYAYADKFTMILTGIGTGIGGPPIDDFCSLIADVSGANMSHTDMSHTDMSGANMHGVDMSRADMRFANMRGADMSYANMYGAHMSCADMSHVNMRGANMRYANMRYVNISHADVCGADMSGANISNADMSHAKNLDSVIFNENTAFFALQCPEEGSFIGWKKAKGDTTVKLKVTENSKRSSTTTRKCRCSEAEVLNIYDSKGNELKTAVSTHNPDFIYTVGETLKVDDFDENRYNECSAGIHFFITRKEAENYS